MTRVLFMKELEALLSDLPKEEKEEALKYYNDYFEDAGAEHEEEILKELVSPQRVASIIKSELEKDSYEQETKGSFTERGYQDSNYQEERYALDLSKEKTDRKEESGQTGQNTTSNQGHQESTQTNNSRTVLLLLICIFAIPIGFPIIMTVFGVILGVIAAIVGIILGFGISGLAMMGVGLALAIAGIIKISIPLIGLAMCGIGLLILGIGMLFVFLSILLCRKALPAMIKGIVHLCRLPFRNRSVMA